MLPGRNELLPVAALRREPSLAAGKLAVGMKFGDVEQPAVAQNAAGLGEDRGEAFDMLEDQGDDDQVAGIIFGWPVLRDITDLETHRGLVDVGSGPLEHGLREIHGHDLPGLCGQEFGVQPGTAARLEHPGAGDLKIGSAQALHVQVARAIGAVIVLFGQRS